jgi:hypothetical protein
LESSATQRLLVKLVELHDHRFHYRGAVAAFRLVSSRTYVVDKNLVVSLQVLQRIVVRYSGR